MKSFTPDQFIGELQSLAKAISGRSVNERLGRLCRKIIYRRVKDGYGVSSEKTPAESTERVKLKPLSKSYIAQREGKVTFMTLRDGRVIPIDLSKMSKQNKLGKGFFKPRLGEFGRPKKSNATFTGDMLSNIQMKYDQYGFQLLILNTRRDDGLTNKKVAEYYSEDRPFFALTSGEIRILTRELEKIVKEYIQKRL